MGRPRKHNLDFPLNVQHRHGKFYYTVGGTWRNLGADKEEAFRVARNLNTTAKADRLAAVAFEREASAELRRLIFARDSETCVYCGSNESLGLDHVIAVENGGGTTERNLVVCCEECNSSKGTLHLADFLAKLNRAFERFLESKISA